MIYNNGLTLSCPSKQSQTSGEIINYVSVDAERMGRFCYYMHNPWMLALQVVLALLVLYKRFGLAVIAAFIIIVLVMLANIPLGRMEENFQKKLMKSKDERMKATSEVLRNIRILKLQGILQEPIYNLPDLISTIVQTKVSLDRIASFLQLDDLQPDLMEKLPREMERERYKQVFEACNLNKDLKVLSFGDQTVIDERGINLSGGQKQIILIARALFQDTNIYLLDDPFSTVDAHIGSRLFQEVLLGIMSSKIVIYVTRQVEFLPAADLILVFQIGCNYWMAWASPVSTDAEHPASTDQSAVDLNIPNQVTSFSFSVIRLLGIIAIVSLVAWQILIIFVPMTATYIWYQQYYISFARELSMLVGVCRAPIIWNFFEIILGATTIRSFNQESRFQQTNMILMDVISRRRFHATAEVEWLCFCLDTLSSITFAFYLFFLVSMGIIDPVSDCSVDNKIISIERILQYNSIPREPSLAIETNSPDRSSPFRGEVRIYDLQVLQLYNGRAGSGKTTLIQTLFRIVEPAAGLIIIDGVDISSIRLYDLRLLLNIIPQDPTIFEGTVRSNLDPLEEYTDEQIWELVCLGRVLLKKSKILVLDEATVSVDTATDNLIQTTLKEHFSDCTVIIIAHRITSVLDSDMVLLVNQGFIEEYDSRASLLENKSSSFPQLVAEAVATMAMAARVSPRGSIRHFSIASPNSFMPPPIAAMGNGEGTPGLNKRTTTEKLREAFSPFGRVIDARVVTDRVSGYSKGFGFVRYATIEEAEKGRVGMDGKFLDGWVIFAEYARPRPERTP
ncbi:ABC transporter C family member 7 [Hibiscus syriacus]|uniref:ABC-type xenobiotic transporter n=1 Tax=Hibiscus syriacus TaxID=106335 RepID=A0A6A2XRD1_HIBSY|nr:ABC transporter C family member 7 [Hibiscus syriacus]